MQEKSRQACQDGQHEEGDSPCPQAGLVALEVLQSLGGDHVGQVQHVAQGPTCIAVANLKQKSRVSTAR